MIAASGRKGEVIPMDEPRLKRNIAEKLTFYRKQANLTQAEVAEQINYSDKSVSKWERAEGLPDVLVLALLAEIYGVTVNDFLSDELPEPEPREPEPREELPAVIVKKDRTMVTLLSVGLVWLVASVVFFTLKLIIPELQNAVMIFVAAIPASCIVAVVFACLWGNLLAQGISVSALVWSLATFFDLSVPLENSQLIYVVAAILQLLVVFWYLLKYKPDVLKHKHKEQEAEPQNTPEE